jgi:hypothetical protein
MSPTPPPLWTDEELELDRRVAMTAFREERLQEPLEQYLETFDTYRGAVEDLLEATVDLTSLSSSNFSVLTDPALLEALRYLAGPPISKDDLKILADASLAPGRLKADPEMAQRVVETILIALDRRRFPWISEGREPEEGEREARWRWFSGSVNEGDFHPWRRTSEWGVLYRDNVWRPKG